MASSRNNRTIGIEKQYVFAMKSLSELYLSNKDRHKAQMVASEMEQTKKYFYAEHEALRRYENSRRPSLSSEIISINVSQRMNNKIHPVKSTHREARMLEDKGISKWTSVEVRKSEDDCPFDVIMLNRTEPKLTGNIETNEFRVGQTTSRTEGKRPEYLRIPSSNESLSVMVNKQDIVLCRSARNAEAEHTPIPHVERDYGHRMEESSVSNRTTSKLSSSVKSDEIPPDSTGRDTNSCVTEGNRSEPRMRFESRKCSESKGVSIEDEFSIEDEVSVEEDVSIKDEISIEDEVSM